MHLREAAPRFRAVPVSASPPRQAFTPSITLDKQDKLFFREHMDSLKKPETLAGPELSGADQQGRRRSKENVVSHSAVSTNRDRSVDRIDAPEPTRTQPLKGAAKAAPKTAPKTVIKPSVSTISSRSSLPLGSVTESLAHQLAKTREADKSISDALLTLAGAGYIVQPPKHLHGEPERQRDDQKTTQEKVVPSGHAKWIVVDPSCPAEAAGGASRLGSSMDEERKRIEAEISAAFWKRGPGPVAAVRSARSPYQISFDRAVPQLCDPSPPLTPKSSGSPGTGWLEPGKRVESPVPIQNIMTDGGPPVDAAWGGEKGPCSVAYNSSRHTWEGNAKCPDDDMLPRIPPDCDDNLSGRRAANEARLLNIDVGLVAHLLTIAADFVPPADSRSVDTYPRGSRLLIRLLVAIRNHIPVHHNGLQSNPASLRLLARLYGIIRPYMPEDGASPKITNGGIRRLLGDVLVEIREFYPVFDPKVGHLADDYELPQGRPHSPTESSISHGNQQGHEPDDHVAIQHVPERAHKDPMETTGMRPQAEDRDVKQDDPVAPASDKQPSPAAHARTQQQHPHLQGGPVLPLPSP
ncbi:hypothetical protein MAPG_09064, partial [Magnaporthiopsis poae ATCC 64411]